MTTFDSSDIWREQQQSAEFDRLLAEIADWTARAPRWPPFRQAAALWGRIEPRLRELQSRLDRVLVVGVVGGTGAGKSTLVNAIVGKSVSPASDIQRPTTTRPVIVCHPDVDPSFLHFASDRGPAPGLSAGERDRGSVPGHLAFRGSAADGSPAGGFGAEVEHVDSPLLSAMILIDCPDPDTQGDSIETTNRNRDLLRRVLPECDVMLFVATAQKYKTAAVADEVLAHAPGRQIVFIQTHAALDHDIRPDWKRLLESQGFAVPHMFLIDSQEAIDRQERGEPATDALNSLRDFLRAELAERARRRIRRTNALDLIGWWLKQVEQESENLRPAVEMLEERIAGEESRLSEKVRSRLIDRLRDDRQWWRTALLRQSASRWGGGPFAALVRMLDRPLAPWRWLLPIRGRMMVASGAAEQLRPAGFLAESASIAELGISDADIAEARSILRQQADRAGLVPPPVEGRADSETSQPAITALARQLAQRATTAVEESIERRAVRYAGPIFHGLLELLFTALLALLVARLGWNFFYEHTWLGKPLLGLDYLVYAAMWLLVWGLVLRWILAARLQRGLSREIGRLVERLNCQQVVGLLFGDLRHEVEQIRRHAEALDAVKSLQESLADRLGGEASQLARLRV